MKKFYALFALALMMLPSALMAQTMTEENEILSGENYNMRLEKDVNFRDGYVNGQEIVPNNQLTFTGTNLDYTINKNAVQQVTNEGLEFMAVELPGNGIALVNGTGLRSTSNERWIVVDGLRQGQILAIEISDTTAARFVPNSNACNSGTGWSDTFVEPLIVEEISKEVHQLQEIAAGNTGEEGEESAADMYRYFKVINDGSMYAKFNGKGTSNTIYRMQIWSPKGEAEVVSAPILKLAGVDGTQRSIEFKSGSSTLGSKCTTWWGIVEQGETALYMEETEEVDHIEYVYQLDEEGKQVLDENQQPIVLEEIPVYKKVLAPRDGIYGDREFVPGESDTETVSDLDDEDGDGFVTIEAATVSETGAFSDIVTLKVAVGEIVLNSPTLTLTGINGEIRTYSISWNNNTLCGEEYFYTVEYDNDGFYESQAANEAFLTFDVRNNIKVTISVEGYTDGVTELAEVEAQGVDMQMKEVGNHQSEQHNWDFCSLTDETLAAINQQVFDHYAVFDEEGNEIRTYTVAEYNNEEIPEEDIDLAEPVVKNMGWDGADSRNTARHWRTWIPTYAEDGETIESSVYAEETTGLLEGLIVDNDHPKYSTMAIFTNNSGLFFMSRGSITISADKLTCGEYIMLGTNNGVTLTQYTDPWSDLVLSIGNGVYVHYIDVFTYDNLPDDIKAIAGNDNENKNVYTLDGRRVNRNGLQKGLYIINGKKVLVK